MLGSGTKYPQFVREYNEAAARLLACGADANCPDQDGNTALHFAARRQQGYPEIIQRLVELGADVNRLNNRLEFGLESLHVKYVYYVQMK